MLGRSVVKMKIVLATKNRHKVEEIQSFLKDLGVVIVPLSLIPSPPGGEGKGEGDILLKEEGATLRENALSKARAVADATGQWALADDTGLFVDALEGKPGIHSARYAGAEGDAVKNIARLLEEMKNIPEEKRGAHFACVLALAHPNGREVTVEGRLEGKIAFSPRGNRGFGYDPVFILPERGLTLAELGLEEKNRISHRGRALEGMKTILQQMSS